MKYYVFSLCTLITASLMASDERTPIVTHTLAERLATIDKSQASYLHCGVDTQKYCCVDDCGSQNLLCCVRGTDDYYGRIRNLARAVNNSPAADAHIQNRLERAKNKEFLGCIGCGGVGGLVGMLSCVVSAAHHMPAGPALNATMAAIIVGGFIVPCCCGMRHSGGWCTERELRNIAREQPNLKLSDAPAPQIMYGPGKAKKEN